MIMKIREKQCAGGALKKELGETKKALKMKIPDMESCDYNYQCLNKKCDGPKKGGKQSKCLKGCKCDCSVNGACGAMQKLFLEPDRCRRCGISSCNFPAKKRTSYSQQRKLQTTQKQAAASKPQPKIWGGHKLQPTKKQTIASKPRPKILGGRRLLSAGAHTHDDKHSGGKAGKSIINLQAPGSAHSGPKSKRLSGKKLANEKRYKKLPAMPKIQREICTQPKYDTKSCSVKYTMKGGMKPPKSYRRNQYTYTLCTELFSMLSALENERMLNKVSTTSRH